MEFYFTRHGRLVGLVVAGLIGLWVALARMLVKEGLLHHSAIGVLSVLCLAIALGLYFLKWWAWILTNLTLLAAFVWFCGDALRLGFGHPFAHWYRPVPLIGDNIVSLDVALVLDFLLILLLHRCKPAFRRDANAGSPT
jgi:hypothetical protein